MDALEHLTHIEGWLWGCERVGNSDWTLAFDVGQCIGSDPEPLQVGAGDVQVYLIASS